MAASVGSPFATSGTPQRLPDSRPLGDVVIRVNDASLTDKVGIRIHAEALVEAAHCDFFIVGGESIKICRNRVSLCSEISVVALSGTPTVYWGFV